MERQSMCVETIEKRFRYRRLRECYARIEGSFHAELFDSSA